jgi:AbrB family looped-hinge helix DNA binding protein
MSGTYLTQVGDRGRIVLPAELRAEAGLEPGTAVTLVATDSGVVLLTREQLRDWVRRDLEGLDLVHDLLMSRRREVDGDAA